MASIGEDRMDLDGRRPPARRESESEERRRSLTSSLSEGTSKFFTSMIAKKNGLLSDLSSKIETTFMKPGTSSSASSASSSPPSSPVTPRPAPHPHTASGKGAKERENAAARRSYALGSRTYSSSGYSEASGSEDHVVLNGVNISFDEPLYSARDSPAPARTFETSAMGPDRRQTGAPQRSGSAERPPGGGAERPRPPPAGRSMSMVDGGRERGRPDPVRQASRQSSMGSRQGSLDKPPRPDKPPQIKPRKTVPDSPGGPSSPKPASPRGQQGPSGPSPAPPAAGAAAASAPARYGPEGAQQPLVPPRGARSEAARPTPTGSSRSGSESESLGGRNSPKVGAPREEKPESPAEQGDTSPTAARRAPKFTTTKRRSSTVDELLFDDYVEPDSQTLPDAAFDPEKPPEDLMSFEAPHERKKISPYPNAGSQDSSDGGNLRDHRNFASGSVDSSDAEFGGTQLRRSGSQASDKSWSSTYSIDSQPDDLTLECMSFMKTFVDKIFHNNDEISQTEKAKFGELCQHAPGRLWFSRYVNSQRSNKRVDETVFFHLMQYFAVCLFECNEAEDFSPAKTLMNMCFTFYHETVLPGGVVGKNFLYSLLRDQPIWQSLRFWNAAFFDAVQCERAHRPMPTSHDGNDDQTDDRHFQENITFGQLGTFTCNMRAFGLSKELCLEFLRKQAVIANLSEEQVALLRENVEKWKEH